jgi:hypothetical protein
MFTVVRVEPASYFELPARPHVPGPRLAGASSPEALVGRCRQLVPLLCAHDSPTDSCLDRRACSANRRHDNRVRSWVKRSFPIVAATMLRIVTPALFCDSKMALSRAPPSDPWLHWNPASRNPSHLVRSQTRSSAIASWKATTGRCLYAIINGASQQHGARASLLARAPRVRLPTVVYFSSCVLCCQIESKGEAHI